MELILAGTPPILSPQVLILVRRYFFDQCGGVTTMWYAELLRDYMLVVILPTQLFI